MEISWMGHSCFRLNERGLGSVVCDPYDHLAIGYEPLKLKADIITVSNEKPGHSCVTGFKNDPFIINRPGEYEINNIYITGYNSNAQGQPRNTLFVIEMNGIFIAHLGNIDRMPKQSELESIGTIHVLLIPVGGGAALNASKAVEMISMIQPNIVIPMHYSVPLTKPELDPLSKFLKEMGITQTEEVYTSYKITNASILPEETKIVILNHPQGAEMREMQDDGVADTEESGETGA